jgi:hypothetical protein
MQHVTVKNICAHNSAKVLAIAASWRTNTINMEL